MVIMESKELCLDFTEAYDVWENAMYNLLTKGGDFGIKDPIGEDNLTRALNSNYRKSIVEAALLGASRAFGERDRKFQDRVISERISVIDVCDYYVTSKYLAWASKWLSNFLQNYQNDPKNFRFNEEFFEDYRESWSVDGISDDINGSIEALCAVVVLSVSACHVDGSITSVAATDGDSGSGVTVNISKRFTYNSYGSTQINYGNNSTQNMRGH